MEKTTSQYTNEEQRDSGVYSGMNSEEMHQLLLPAVKGNVERRLSSVHGTGSICSTPSVWNMHCAMRPECRAA